MNNMTTIKIEGTLKNYKHFIMSMIDTSELDEADLNYRYATYPEGEIELTIYASENGFNLAMNIINAAGEFAMEDYLEEVA